VLSLPDHRVIIVFVSKTHMVDTEVGGHTRNSLKACSGVRFPLSDQFTKSWIVGVYVIVCVDVCLFVRVYVYVIVCVRRCT
jgi:hypothetical protein